MTDNGARALAERIDDVGIFDVVPERRLLGWSFDRLADAILANGAAFLPDAAETEAEHDRQLAAGTHLFAEGCRYCCAAELDRLRRIEAAAREFRDAARALVERTPNEVTYMRFDVETVNLDLALQPEGSAGT